MRHDHSIAQTDGTQMTALRCTIPMPWQVWGSSQCHLRTGCYETHLWPKRSYCAGGLALLDWRTWDIRVRAINAAIAFERLQNRFTGFAFIKPLTGICRHGFDLNVSAQWAGQRGVQSYFHFFNRHTAYPVTMKNPASKTQPYSKNVIGLYK